MWGCDDKFLYEFLLEKIVGIWDLFTKSDIIILSPS